MLRRELKRRRLLESLEPRHLLNAAPIAVADPWYETSLNTTLVVGTSDTTLLDNDWDPEGDSITASLVDSPANGTLTAFNSNGTFTYVPDTSFSGFDSFTYKTSDGTDYSNVVTVSIAVDGDFGVRTNQDESPQDGFYLAGDLSLAEPLTPGLRLLYQSNTLPGPIVVIETSLLPGSSVPDDIDAQLTFNGSAGTTYNYDTTSLSAGDSLRFALLTDGSSLSTGHYDYSVELTANYTRDRPRGPSREARTWSIAATARTRSVAAGNLPGSMNWSLTAAARCGFDRMAQVCGSPMTARAGSSLPTVISPSRPSWKTPAPPTR